MHKRNASIDILRFAAALAIVWFHLPIAGGSAALAALHVFMALQVFFGVGRNLRAQAVRLMVPWLFWSAFYAAGRCLQALMQDRPIASEFETWMLLTGAALHLWYLPFSLIAVATGTLLLKSSPRICAIICSVMFLAGIIVTNTVYLTIPWIQYISVTPAIALGILLARDFNRFWIIAFTVGLSAVFVFLIGWSSVALQIMLAGILIGIAFVFPLNSNKLTNWFRSTSFGIYLVHPAAYSCLLMVSDFQGILLFVATATISIFAVVILQRFIPWSVM